MNRHTLNTQLYCLSCPIFNVSSRAFSKLNQFMPSTKGFQPAKTRKSSLLSMESSQQSQRTSKF
ncbi:hypothetical protein K435DRAFT_779782, partial [Dendrothele bispora CBS 962.96]